MSLDQFFTSPELAARMVDWAVLSRGDKVLEPSAGDGAIVQALPLNVEVTALDIDPAMVVGLRQIQRPGLTVGDVDFLLWETDARFDVAIMNPPYSTIGGADGLHIMRATRYAKRVVALVRLNFLASVQRYNALWRWVEVYRAAILVRRPKFHGPDDKGHTARHDYMVIEVGKRAAGERVLTGPHSVDADVALEFWV
jgi:predicted RNA methylase